MTQGWSYGTGYMSFIVYAFILVCKIRDRCREVPIPLALMPWYFSPPYAGGPTFLPSWLGFDHMTCFGPWNESEVMDASDNTQWTHRTCKIQEGHMSGVTWSRVGSENQSPGGKLEVLANQIGTEVFPLPGVWLLIIAVLLVPFNIHEHFSKKSTNWLWEDVAS